MAEDNGLFLSVIIPAYNEEEHIVRNLDTILDYFRQRTYLFEIIIVDDGSNDKTREYIDRYADRFENITILKNDRNMGKGYSIRRGVFASRAKYIFFCDADLSVAIQELEKLLHWMDKGFDIVIGSKRHPDSAIRRYQPLYRNLLGNLFAFLVRLCVIKEFYDTQTGFKCFHKDTAVNLFARQTIYRFGFDVEILYLAVKYGYRVKEVPIMSKDFSESTINLLKDPLLMLGDLFKVRINDILGRYD